MLEQNLIRTKLEPLARRKMIQYLGDLEDDDLLNFVLDHLKEKKPAKELVEGLEPVSLPFPPLSPRPLPLARLCACTVNLHFEGAQKRVSSIPQQGKELSIGSLLLSSSSRSPCPPLPMRLSLLRSCSCVSSFPLGLTSHRYVMLTPLLSLPLALSLLHLLISLPSPGPRRRGYALHGRPLARHRLRESRFWGGLRDAGHDGRLSRTR